MTHRHRNTCRSHLYVGAECDCGWPNVPVPSFDADGPEVEPLPLEPFEPDDEGET